MEWLVDDLLIFLRNLQEVPDADVFLTGLLKASGIKSANVHAMACEILALGARATPDRFFRPQWAGTVSMLLHLYAGPIAKNLVVEIYGPRWDGLLPPYKYDRSDIDILEVPNETGRIK